MSRLAVVLTVSLLLAATAAAEPPASTAQRIRLANQVRHELVMLPFYSVFDNLLFQVDGHAIILSGQVSRPTLKADAERVVRRVEDVETVVNHIEVLPHSAHDDEIRLAIYRALYGHAALNRYVLHSVPPIHIIVRRGNVALEGAVATATEKQIAGMLANGVSGVFSVTNNLRVDE